MSNQQQNLFIQPIATNVFSSKPLLRYPGGKTRAVAFITQYFPEKVEEMLSPFMGGGSIEVFMAAKGTMVFGYDVFPPLVEFWQCLLQAPNQLADEVVKYFPLPKEKFYELQKTQTSFATKLQRAAVYYVLNRCSFSGSTLSGGMSPNHPRFTQTAIDRLLAFHNSNLIVAQASFEESLAKHPNIFTYLDPPYLIKNSLYGKKGDAHKDFNHTALASLLQKRKQWILSYNDCDEIRTLYKGFTILTPNWKYGMSSDKTSKEVLVLSKDLVTKGF